MFRYSALPCPMLKVVIHGGSKVMHDRGLHVPKRDLIDAEMSTTASSCRRRPGTTATTRGNSQHDDLVLAVALAAWYRGYLNRGE